MTSSSKSTDSPTFIVGPQPFSKQPPTKGGQEIVFKSDQRQYKNGLRPQLAARARNSSGLEPQSHVYSGKIRFATPKTQVRFTPKQELVGERPSKRPKVGKRKCNGERSLFSTRRPLRIHVPTDAWQLIFQRCDLAFLLKARLVCRAFRDILDRQALWREARTNQFGNEIPDRPLAITEFQYARLLVGRGCQVAPCPRRDTRKVYWPFMLRMCDRCFNKMVEVPNLDCQEARLYSEMYRSLEYEVRQTIPAQLPGLLPAGTLRSYRWNGPRALDSDNRKWLSIVASDGIIVLTESYDALKLDFNEKVQDDPDYFLFWARLRWGKTCEQMSLALKLNEMDVTESPQPCNLRESKMVLFAEQALKLDPPMTFEVLQKFAAYHSALDTKNAASLRGWDALKAKIDVPELRAQAELLTKWEEEEEVVESSTISRDDLQERLRRHRKAGRVMGRLDEYTPEQKVVMEIAYEELETLLDVVHDYDVLLMWFNQVRQAYESLYQKPEGLNGDGIRGPYELMLDDALMIVQDILHPMLLEVSDDGIDRYQRVLTSLRCMGCIRSNTASTYSFRELIDHACRAHAGTVAKDSFWYKLAVPAKSSGRNYKEKVAWYQLPWFKTMPALPFHRKVSSGTIWNPDMETEYVQHEEAPKPFPVTFDKPVPYQTRIPGEDFTSNFCRAVRTLIPTRLDSLYVIKVALEYSKRRSRPQLSALNPASQITVKQLQNLETICARFTSRLDFKFRCRRCFEEVTKSRNRSRLPKPQTLTALTLHWRWQCRRNLDDAMCTTQRIMLPTETDLMATIEREDAKLEAEKTSVLKKSIRKFESVDPRTAALLETPSIRSCFDKLFVPHRQGSMASPLEHMMEDEASLSTRDTSFSSSSSHSAMTSRRHEAK